MTFPFFETFILSIFDTIQYYVITNKLNHGIIRFRKIHLAYLLICALCGAVSSVAIQGVNSYFMNTLILMTFSFILYRRKGSHLIFLHIISMTLIVIIQFALLFPMYALLGKIEYTFFSGLMAQIAASVLSIVIAKNLPIQYLFRYIETKNKMFEIISLNVFILITFCVIFWQIRFEGVVENLLLISVIIVVVLLINLMFLKEGLKNHVIEEQNRAYECYMPIVNELMDEIRVKQHDFNNHIAALKGVLEQRKEAQATVERVEDYIHEIEASFHHMDLLKMKNRIVAGFLYSKKKQSQEAGIEMDICIEDYQLTTDLKDYELLDILSILIDNAFETGVADNVVKVHFYKEKNKSVIEVANKHSYISTTQINEFFTKGFSSKSASKRGLGLYKLKQLVSGYQGEIEVLNSGQGENFIVFKVSIS